MGQMGQMGQMGSWGRWKGDGEIDEYNKEEGTRGRRRTLERVEDLRKHWAEDRVSNQPAGCRRLEIGDWRSAGRDD